MQQQATASARSTTIDIDAIIAVLRSSTQTQYNARELHSTVRFTDVFFFFFQLIIVYSM